MNALLNDGASVGLGQPLTAVAAARSPAKAEEGRLASTGVMGVLGDVCQRQGALDLEARLRELSALLGDDLESVERDLGGLELGRSPLGRSASHLLDQPGKRLRPICVALAARLGAGFSDVARSLAVAVELMHSATLLHDDVVDVGDVRRGRPTSRVIYGNAASVFAGDLLLVEALLRVRRAGDVELLDRALQVLAEMLEAESLQLSWRGRVDGTVHDYLRVARGKTASLFRWAMLAGARAGGLDPSACCALERYGEDLGVAFQVVDDALDAAGDEAGAGKTVLADVREGKLTYPLLVALDRMPQLRDDLRTVAASDDAAPDAAALARIARGLRDTGAVDEARSYARMLAQRAAASVGDLGSDGPARRALVGIALALPERTR